MTGFAVLAVAGEADAGADVRAMVAVTATAHMGENRIGLSIDSHRDRLNRPPRVWHHPQLDLGVRPYRAGHEGTLNELRAHTEILPTLVQAGGDLRALGIGERGNSLLKMTFKALCNVSLDPWRIGKIVAAALVILHVDHARTT